MTGKRLITRNQESILILNYCKSFLDWLTLPRFPSTHSKRLIWMKLQLKEDYCNVLFLVEARCSWNFHSSKDIKPKLIPNRICLAIYLLSLCKQFTINFRNSRHHPSFLIRCRPSIITNNRKVPKFLRYLSLFQHSDGNQKCSVVVNQVIPQ